MEIDFSSPRLQPKGNTSSAPLSHFMFPNPAAAVNAALLMDYPAGTEFLVLDVEASS